MREIMQLTAYRIRKFRTLVYEHYDRHGRDLPWRKTDDPYRIIVSEIMLQQTQVGRVIDKYHEFMTEFPDVVALSRASLRDVLRVWRGLGYNRRARSLKKAAEIIVAEYHGEVPSEPRLLMKLPGIGDTTAHAVCAYAFNRPVVFIETNIRAVFIHHYFQGRTPVKDGDIRYLVEQTLDRDEPRRWYNALMDYGVMIKKRYRNPARESAHYRKQGPFKGSNREIRGAILRVLTMNGACKYQQLLRELPFDEQRIQAGIIELEGEGMIKKDGSYVSVA